jgi:hypothetical protein
MSQRDLLKDLTKNFTYEQLTRFFRNISLDFKPVSEDLTSQIDRDPDFIRSIKKIGEITFEDERRLVIVTSQLQGEITERTSKIKQFDIGWKYLKREFYDAGIFVFRDDRGHFRFSLIVTKYSGNKRTHTPFRRYTYYIDPEKPNKTFINQIGRAKFSGIDTILKAFSIDTVSDEFYNEFKPKFNEISAQVQGTDDGKLKEDFALLFVIRVIFIGFVQKRGWLQHEEFVQVFWREYLNSGEEDEFYKKWLVPLFFEALNSPPGRKVKYRNNEFSKETEDILLMAPFLNGELFKPKKGYDGQGFWIPDEQIAEFLEFLFQYNFTIEENTFYDEELELNPEFLGIIFERLVNKEDGAVYTPRTEVDFMCRMGLVKWLQKNSSADTNDLYHLFFRDRGRAAEFDEDQKQGDFTTAQIRELVELLSNVTVCDPAAGSGAFEVGMLHVLHDILDNLYRRHNAPDELPEWDDFEQKKSIIARSLYGVEVKEWAVWINQLRLWLTLFIDMPDDYKTSPKPLLPSLNFKVRQGDTLVQRVGNKLFPVQGHAHLSSSIKRKITELKKAKVDFFYNRGGSYDDLRGKENNIFRSILDVEITAKRKQLRGFSNPRGVQGDLLGASGPSQSELDMDEKEKEKIKAEIAELEAQKKALGENHPLIWNIEFAEIFFDQGGFDVVIGNPPYVRQEEIGDPFGNLDPKAYKNELEAAIRGDFPDYFRAGITISGRSDLFTYFYIRSLRLLNEQGELIFICSNSWLDVGYGDWLQRFLLRMTEVDGIVDNHAKRSFASADVNTVITFMGAPKKQKDWMEGTVPFIAFKKPFEEVIIADHLLTIEHARQTVANEQFRVFPVPKKRLVEEGSEFENPEDKKLFHGTYVGDKWGGKYLRAPDIFFTILEKGEEKLEKLSELADIRRGITTGANDFFYLTEEVAKYHKIEKEYLRPAILKTDEVKIPISSKNDFDGYFFWCSEDKTDIVGTKALEYIEWGERQSIEVKQGSRKGEVLDGFHEVSSVQSRRNWYDIAKREPAPVWWIIAHNERSIAFFNEDYVCSDNFFEISPYEYPPETLALYLSSTVACLYKELLGRSNFGGGLLKTQKPDLQKIDVVKGLKIDKSIQFALNEVNSIFKECGINPESEVHISEQEPEPLPDRAELDNIVFEALGLTQEERKEVYRAVCQLVWNRVSKARSV